jgi:hypothetical protein
VKYIDRIQRNSIVNLSIGILGTIASISILAFSFLGYKPIEVIPFIIFFIPKLLFAAFVQLFAFFFLRLYKNNLEDAKYFQNELTNLAAKTASLKISYLAKKEDLFSDIVKDLSITERNFKLNKNESLLNIEKAKIEKELDLETIIAIKDLLKSMKSTSSSGKE